MKKLGIDIVKVGIGIAIGIAVLFSFDLFRKEPIPSYVQKEVLKPLKNNETVRIVTSRNTVTTVKRNSKPVTKFVPPTGYVSTTVTKDGEVTVKVKNKGLALRPGFGIMMADKPRLSLDLQLWYWNRVYKLALLSIHYNNNLHLCQGLRHPTLAYLLNSRLNKDIHTPRLPRFISIILYFSCKSTFMEFFSRKFCVKALFKPSIKLPITGYKTRI